MIELTKKDLADMFLKLCKTAEYNAIALQYNKDEKRLRDLYKVVSTVAGCLYVFFNNKEDKE